MTNRPCPFCTGIDLSVTVCDHPEFSHTVFQIVCECGAFGPSSVSEAAAWQTWNNRGAVA